MTGNGPIAALKADYDAAESGRHHTVVNLHVEDYSDFLDEIYEEALKLGDR